MTQTPLNYKSCSLIRQQRRYYKFVEGKRSVHQEKDFYLVKRITSLFEESRLKRALTTLCELVSPEPHHYIITSERGEKMLACNISHWFKNVFKTLRLEGCSSHSGRRTFITNAARKIIEVGGSLRDVQQLAGHTSLQMTQRYIEGNTEAKRKVIDLI